MDSSGPHRRNLAPDTKASVLFMTRRGVPLLWGVLFYKDGYLPLEKVRCNGTTAAQWGFFWEPSFHVFCFVLFP